MRKLAILAVILLSGCAHNLYFVGRTTGAKGTARVVTNTGQGRTISIALNGKTYTGQWVYVSGGGSLTFATAFATSGAKSATATGTGIGIPTQGNGSILASAADGSSIRCIFDYSEWSSNGMGVCQDDKGEVYDLQIN
jgi:hypothetical protein